MLTDAIVRKLNWMQPLSADEQEEVRGCCQNVRQVKRKRDIISEGQSQTVVHAIESGWAARYSIRRDGSRRITALLLPGDCCDIHGSALAYMDHGIVALTDCYVACIPAQQIDELTRTSPALTKAFWRSTLIDEAILRRWLTNSGDALTNMAHLICELHLRLSMTGQLSGSTFNFPITQADLGDALALTAVHVNRTFGRLRNLNLIEKTPGGLRIVDLDRLRDAGNFNPNYLHLRG